MTDLYNITPLSNSSGPLVVFQTINNNTGSWFIGTSLIMIFLILFVLFRRNGVPDSFLASSFIVSILSGLAFGMGVMPSWQLLFPITMLVASVILKVWGEG